LMLEKIHDVLQGKNQDPCVRGQVAGSILHRVISDQAITKAWSSWASVSHVVQLTFGTVLKSALGLG
jgi:hypothetical protein